VKVWKAFFANTPSFSQNQQAINGGFFLPWNKFHDPPWQIRNKK